MVSVAVWVWCHNNDLYTVSEGHLGAVMAGPLETAANLINSDKLEYLLLRRNSLILICSCIDQTTFYALMNSLQE